ncbi:MAG TPA: hypothetical protein VEP93_08940, partial [Variovorax sp.]|nr:hypothetical protein [Variovorax sp.]
ARASTPAATEQRSGDGAEGSAFGCRICFVEAVSYKLMVNHFVFRVVPRSETAREEFTVVAPISA